MRRNPWHSLAMKNFNFQQPGIIIILEPYIDPSKAMVKDHFQKAPNERILKINISSS